MAIEIGKTLVNPTIVASLIFQDPNFKGLVTATRNKDVDLVKAYSAALEKIYRLEEIISALEKVA